MKQGKWKRFFGYYKPYKGVFAADLFFAFLGAVVTLIIPLIVRYITGTVLEREASEALQAIIPLGALMIGLVILECYCNYFIAYYGHVMGTKMEANMRSEIFEHYQKLSFSFYDEQKVGQLMSRVTTDLFDISELFHHGPEDIVISLIKLVGSFGILLSVNWRLAFTAFTFIPIMVGFAGYYNIQMKRAFKQNRARIADINAQIEDNLSGIRVVKSFANEEIEKGKFEVGNENFIKSKKNSYRYMGIYHAGLGAFTTMIQILVILAGAVLIVKGTVTVTDLVTFLLYINNFTEPVRKLINFTEQFQNGASGYERFLEILSVEPDIQDRKGAKEMTEVQGKIVFEQVSFHYEEHTEEVLQKIDLEVEPGEYIALVGSSGAGKSTLCSLIPRFYEVSEGAVKIDGVDIRDFTMRSLRKNIGIVQQDVYLFAGSVMENIRYGRPDATEEEVIMAAKHANAHEFIMGLPDGYHTYIGQRGIKLSGGQKQRLSIARVFLKNPPILIFDEATSALDNETERRINESIEMCRDKTVIIIAHRESALQNLDRVIDFSIANE